jgi:hypothetical protein
MSKGFWRFTGTKLIPIETESSISHQNTIACQPMEKQITFLPLPMKFKPSEWPTRTNTACVWCSNHHDNIPIPHLKNIEVKNDEYIVMVETFHYCSWNCYRANTMDDSTHWKLVIFFASIFYPNISIVAIPPALPKTVLQKYGGRLTHNEYISGHVINSRTE